MSAMTLAPSILAADFARLGEQVAEAEGVRSQLPSLTPDPEPRPAQKKSHSVSVA
jgi:hypothetical protein